MNSLIQWVPGWMKEEYNGREIMSESDRKKKSKLLSHYPVQKVH